MYGWENQIKTINIQSGISIQVGKYINICSAKQRTLQGVQVQSGPFISSIVFIPLVVRGYNINFLIQKGGENDVQLLKL